MPGISNKNRIVVIPLVVRVFLQWYACETRVGRFVSY
jgi:hypothetical protein